MRAASGIARSRKAPTSAALRYPRTVPPSRFVLRRKPPGDLLKGAHAIDREAKVLAGLEKGGFPVAHVHGARLDDLIAALEITIEPTTVQQGEIARRAYQRFGRGSGSPARLNFGDCFAYALSVTTGEPLLFVGEDFVHTDVVPAMS